MHNLKQILVKYHELGGKNDNIDPDYGIVVGARMVALNISQTVDLQG